MKIALVGNNSRLLTQKISLTHHTIVKDNPDVVLCFGGDGTFLASERQFPGVPKFCLRDGRPCKACTALSLDETFARLSARLYAVKEFSKVEAEVKGQTLVAVNEVQLHNNDPRHAIRFTVTFNGQESQSVIADGAIFASAFGSTGYFQSVTGQTFEEGFAFAIINPAKKADHILLHASDVVMIQLERGPATVYADNDPTSIFVPAGSSVTFRPSAQKAKVIVFP